MESREKPLENHKQTFTSGPQAAEATPSETPSCAPSKRKSKLRVTTGRVCVPTPRVRNFSVLVGGDRSPSPKRVSFDQSCATKQHGRVGNDVKRLSPPLRREVKELLFSRDLPHALCKLCGRWVRHWQGGWQAGAQRAPSVRPHSKAMASKLGTALGANGCVVRGETNQKNNTKDNGTTTKTTLEQHETKAPRPTRARVKSTLRSSMFTQVHQSSPKFIPKHETDYVGMC